MNKFQTNEIIKNLREISKRIENLNNQLAPSKPWWKRPAWWFEHKLFVGFVGMLILMFFWEIPYNNKAIVTFRVHRETEIKIFQLPPPNPKIYGELPGFREIKTDLLKEGSLITPLHLALEVNGYQYKQSGIRIFKRNDIVGVDLLDPPVSIRGQCILKIFPEPIFKEEKYYYLIRKIVGHYGIEVGNYKLYLSHFINIDNKGEINFEIKPKIGFETFNKNIEAFLNIIS